jgi:hypothetical protein
MDAYEVLCVPEVPVFESRVEGYVSDEEEALTSARFWMGEVLRGWAAGTKAPGGAGELGEVVVGELLPIAFTAPDGGRSRGGARPCRLRSARRRASRCS